MGQLFLGLWIASLSRCPYHGDALHFTIRCHLGLGYLVDIAKGRGDESHKMRVQAIGVWDLTGVLHMAICFTSSWLFTEYRDHWRPRNIGCYLDFLYLKIGHAALGNGEECRAKNLTCGGPLRLKSTL